MKKKTNHCMGCDLMVGVIVLHPKKSGSNDNPNKAHVVHVVLFIAVTWHKIDESTLETLFFFIQQKKKKKNRINADFISPFVLFFFFSFICHMNNSLNIHFSLVMDILWHYIFIFNKPIRTNSLKQKLSQEKLILFKFLKGESIIFPCFEST